jgi:hypothetical protein
MGRETVLMPSDVVGEKMTEDSGNKTSNGNKQQLLLL